jgi:predicted dehydrogenase
MDEQNTNPTFISRRAFVGGVATAAGVMIVPRRVLGGPGYQAPSDTVNVATVGYVHGMGTSNTNACADAKANIVALCDVDESEAAMLKMKRSKTPILDRLPNAARYKDFRVMLEKQKDIDAVIVATPDHAHAVVAMAAMQLGKHVYVQKPMTRTISEARALTEAARRYKVVSQMGNQGRSGEGVRLIQEWIEDGAIGEVREVHCWTNRPIWPQGMARPTDTPAVPNGLDWDLWIGPAPMRPFHTAYHPFSWRSWIDFGAGALGDMACHVMDASYSVLKLGSPTSVLASVAYNVVEVQRPDGTTSNQRLKYNDSFPPATVVHYNFPARGKKLPALKFHWYDGGILPERPEELEPDRRLPESGTIFVGTKGKLIGETYSESPRLIPETRMQAYKRPKKTIPRVEGSRHEQNWLDTIKGKTKATSPFDYAGPFTETVLLGNLAIAFPGTKLMWDGAGMKVTNNADANALVQHNYREGWKL